MVAAEVPSFATNPCGRLLDTPHGPPFAIALENPLSRSSTGGPNMGCPSASCTRRASAWGEGRFVPSCWSAGVSCWVVRSARCGSCLLMISWCFGPGRGCPGADLLWAGERQQKRQQPRHTTSLEDLRHPSFGTCDVGGACHRKVMGSVCYLGTEMLRSLGANFEILSGLLNHLTRNCSVPRRQHGLELNVVVVRRISQTACEQPRASAVNAHKP